MYYKNSDNQSKLRKRKRIQQNKKQRKREKQKIINNEIIVLNNIKKLPNELIDHIYSFINNNVKFYASHYFNLYKKYIINYKYNDLYCVYNGYDKYEYCTYYRLSLPLQYMLQKIPLIKLKRYILYGTPQKYFKIAFPFENNIWEYINLNYKFDKNIEEKRKDYIFEIIDILSYFVTKVNDNYLYKNYNCEDYRTFKDNEFIVKKYILSILYIYDKYATT
jgi:hypothetical protein